MPDWSALAADAAAAIAERTGVPRHDAVVVLGSGWGVAAENLGGTVAELPWSELPGFVPPVAPGHAGLVRSTVLGGARLLVFLGRTHLFEGHGPGPVAAAVRTAAAAGCTVAVLTNASGSLRPDWAPGTGVVISDHLNLTGRSPLQGARFVDLTDCWNGRLRQAAMRQDRSLVEGVYAMMTGPSVQTLAETAMVRTLGADLIGMSTVIEAIAAREVGLKLLGLSATTTVEGTGEALDPDQVVAVGAATARRLGPLLAHLLSDETNVPRPRTTPQTEVGPA
ncbi:MAG: purine-nucleoside phosphorylase [Actinomycetota bacterium]|nr:purine-nucleoside phosphorylase [Actinomycetota bacterium]